jgi:hypothetical protein
MRPTRIVILLAVALLGATLLPALASARPAARLAAAGHTKSATGTYTYYDDAGDGPETLVLYSNGYSDFAGSVDDCNGEWVQAGKAISIDIYNNCGLWIFSGTIGPHGALSSASAPGRYLADESGSTFPGTWYAVRGGAAAVASGHPALSHRPLASSDGPRSTTAGGTYSFFYDNQTAGTMVLSSNGSFSNTFPNGRVCTGHWVQSGKSVAIDWTLANDCAPSILAGSVKPKSLSTKQKPGELNIQNDYFHWYATKKK